MGWIQHGNGMQHWSAGDNQHASSALCVRTRHETTLSTGSEQQIWPWSDLLWQHNPAYKAISSSLWGSPKIQKFGNMGAGEALITMVINATTAPPLLNFWTCGEPHRPVDMAAEPPRTMLTCRFPPQLDSVHVGRPMHRVALYLVLVYRPEPKHHFSKYTSFHVLALKHFLLPLLEQGYWARWINDLTHYDTSYEVLMCSYVHL